MESIVVELNKDTGQLIKPTRFLPAVNWPYTHKSYAYGPIDIGSGISSPDLSHGNYTYGWVAYVEFGGGAFIRRHIPNELWDIDSKYLLELVDPLEKVSLEFALDGSVILGYLRKDTSMGIWWRNPDTGLPALLEIDSGIQDIYLTVENKDTPKNTDVFLWYFKGGELFLRLLSEKFTLIHGPYISSLINPVIIQAGINHRYGYQLDYRDLG